MTLNEYETIYIARPDMTDDLTSRLTARILSLVTESGGAVLVTEDWGRRKLAYPIKKQLRGQYIYVNYVSAAKLVHEIERVLGIEDNLLRYLTVRLGENVDIESTRQVAEERRRHRTERMAAQRAEEEAEARYREAEEIEDEVGVEVED